MILVAILLATTLQAAAPAPNLATAGEVVVMGEKLKKWRASVRERKGKMVCTTKSSTGDQELDAIGCNAMATCLTQFKPRLNATLDRTLAAAERKSLRDAADRDLFTCVTTNRDTAAAALAERRYQERQGNR
ncbi:hypothetical protein [Sphingomonas sp. LHG3443-2]|uniref:hypothetical protein n=1 Tax=Sphingomonas sp. LHG3443-2 TaxID=2804639 RepID=UPI003CEAFC38